MNNESYVRQRHRQQSENSEILAMLNNVEFNTNSSSSSTVTTPKRRNRRKLSDESIDSNASTSSTVSSIRNSVANAKRKVQLKKEQRLNKYIEEYNEVDLLKIAQDLRDFAKSECGLINDTIRAKIWPVLAETINDQEDCQSDETSSSCSDSDFETALSSLSFSDDGNGSIVDNLIDTTPTLEELQRHSEWNQVQMDVHRTLARFPPGTSEEERSFLQSDLTPLIVNVLSTSKKFRYYQGFHDICLTLVLVLGRENAFRVAKILAHRTVFKKYLTKSLEETAMHDLQYMYVLLFKCNYKLEEYLREAELGTLFALSWPLTWFSHVLDDYQNVVMCFDLFLSSHLMMPIYVSAAVLNQREKEIYETDKDMPSLHGLLSRIPNHLDIPIVLQTAVKLFQEYPPNMLKHKYHQEYEKKCEESKKRHARVPPANTLSRYSISKWLIAGSVSAATFYLLWTNNYLEFVK